MILKEWAYFNKRENSRIMELFRKFDENGDGVLVLDEFETLIRSFEPKIKRKRVVDLFKETLDKFELRDESDNSENNDILSAEGFCRMVWYHKLGGCGKEFFNDYLKYKTIGGAQANN